MANRNVPRSGGDSVIPVQSVSLFFPDRSSIFISVVPASAEDTQVRANPEHTKVYESGSIEPGNTELWRFTTG